MSVEFELIKKISYEMVQNIWSWVLFYITTLSKHIIYNQY